MTIRATIELILHIHSLTNIQIPHQGLFALEVEFYQLVDGKKNSGTPYQTIENEIKPSKKAFGKSDINDALFRTKIGHLRYTVIELNDMIIFKIEVDSFPNLIDSEIYLDFTLLFSSRYYSDPSQIQNFEATAMQTCRFKIQNIQNGIMHYSEGQFVKNYLSLFSFTVFGMVMDYKFAGYKCTKPEPTNKQLRRQKIQDLQEFLVWSSSIYQMLKEPISYMYETYVKPLCSNSYNLRSSINQFLKIKKQVKLKTSKKFNQSQSVTEKQFIQYLTEFNAKDLSCQDLRVDIAEIHTQNFFFMQDIIQDFAKNRIFYKILQGRFNDYMSQKFGEKVFKSISYGKSVATSKEHLKVVKSIRKKNTSISQYPLVNVNLFEDQNQLVGFYEITYPQQLKNVVQNSANSTKQVMEFIEKEFNHKGRNYQEKNMLIVLCHGYQGSSYDMMMIQRGLKQVLPDTNYLVSNSNQSDTSSDIQQMGQKLALEVLNYIKKNMDQQKMVLNFVGHSMGGIIARASFKHLKKYQQNFGFFCSLGSPHIGYLNGVDGMIKTGLWFINKWQKVISLQQLSMQDKQKPRDSFLYRLSYEGNLRKFSKIILLSSMEDNFVPWHSARICPYKNNNSQTKIEEQMCDNIFGNNIIHRIDINFNCKKNDLDGFIGRTAHINLIVQQNIFKMINWTIPQLFNLHQP